MTNLEKAHRINRILMRKLHSVCEEYGITYYYDSGSLIGAVRHKDFIPWDDDIVSHLQGKNSKSLRKYLRKHGARTLNLWKLKTL